MTKYGWGILAMVFLSCESPVNLAVDGVRPFDPLPEYPEFWSATTSCSGRSGDLERIQWFRAASIVSEGQILRGFWEPPHRITLWAGLEHDEPTVRHEMLHDLLNGDPDHSLSVWAECGLLPQ